MEVDTEAQQQQQQPEQQAPQVSNLQLSILATIKTAQLQNGLKHGDYSRYRCGWCMGSLRAWQGQQRPSFQHSPQPQQGFALLGQ